jgi:uncharacterized membrane protein (UPF0127 family)
MKFNFNYKGKNFELDIEKCDNYFSRARGLMFRKKSKPLLFIFDKENKRAIHSLFCIPFLAVWFDGDKIIDIKFVKSWKFFVKPLKKFDKLLEIPCNSKEFNALKLLTQE